MEHKKSHSKFFKNKGWSKKMRNFSSNFFSEKGMTLIEILVSIVILSMIIVLIIPMFVQSSRSNTMSQNITEATYLAQAEMEEIINMNTSSTSSSVNTLSDGILMRGYQNDISCHKCYGMSRDGHYIFIQLKSISGKLGKVIVKVYKDKKKDKQQAQMEMILSW
jgi:prepilin-type N-terminal cleavage/methylation domain-containing protein